jgi:hypothetical protein
MTFVQNWVIALVFSIAWFRTTRWFCATRNWRENYFGATTTSQLVEGHARTLRTVANVTLFIAFVPTTIQYLIALQITDVIKVNTALHVAPEIKYLILIEIPKKFSESHTYAFHRI